MNEFLQAPPRPPHTFDMGQLLEEMQQIDQQSYRQAPQRGLGLGFFLKEFLFFVFSFGLPSSVFFNSVHVSMVQRQMWQRWLCLVIGRQSSSQVPTPPPHQDSLLSGIQQTQIGRKSLSPRLRVTFFFSCSFFSLVNIPYFISLPTELYNDVTALMAGFAASEIFLGC